MGLLPISFFSGFSQGCDEDNLDRDHAPYNVIFGTFVLFGGIFAIVSWLCVCVDVSLTIAFPTKIRLYKHAFYAKVIVYALPPVIATICTVFPLGLDKVDYVTGSFTPNITPQGPYEFIFFFME